jgi:ketosteroid isomerase-like protein
MSRGGNHAHVAHETEERVERMPRIAYACLIFAVALAGCGATGSPSPSGQADLQRMADLYAIDQIEVNWHKAASTHDLDLMMSLWAADATFTIGGQTYTGTDQIRTFFATKAAPFKPENNWVSDTPAYKIQATVDGDKGTLYFECHYIDPTTKLVVNVVGANQNVERVQGKWVIASSIGASPILGE